jgi:hypothetical protein
VDNGEKKEGISANGHNISFIYDKNVLKLVIVIGCTMCVPTKSYWIKN